MNINVDSTKENALRRNKGKSLMNLPENYTIIDLETTGFDPTFDSIIEMSALKIKNDKIIDEYHTLINPNHEINDFIKILTGIDNGMVKKAPNIKEKIKEFIEFISDDIIIGHNVNFDINFLYDNCKKYLDIELKNDYVDTLRLAKFTLKELEHHRLMDLIEYFNLEIDTFHRALNDSESTYLIYLKLKKIILDKYNSEEEFVKEVKKKNQGVRANEIITNNTKFDITHPLYNKNCVFTGTLKLMARKEAMQKVVDLGGKVQDGVNKDTNFLIIGNLEYSNGIKGNKTNKMKRVEKMQLKGYDVCVLPENVFYELINL